MIYLLLNSVSMVSVLYKVLKRLQFFKYFPAYLCKSIPTKQVFPLYLQVLMPILGIFFLLRERFIYKICIPLFVMLGIGSIINIFQQNWIGEVRILQFACMVLFAHFLAFYYSRDDFFKLALSIIIISAIWFLGEYLFLPTKIEKILIPGSGKMIRCLSGIIGEPNFTGIMLAGIGMVSLAFKRHKLFFVAIILVFFTGSRTSYLLVILTFVFFVENKIPSKIWNFVARLFLGLLLIYPLFILFFDSFATDNAKEWLYHLSSARSGIHQTYINIFKANPLGIGYFNGREFFLDYSHLVASKEMYNSVLLLFKYEQHSIFIQVLIEFGILGYVCFILFTYNILNLALRLNKRLGMGFCILLFGFLMLNGFSEFILYFYVAVIFREALKQKRLDLLNKMIIYK